MPEFPFPLTPVVADPVIATGTTGAAARTLANDAWARNSTGIVNLAANTSLSNILTLGAGRYAETPIDTAKNPQIGSGLTVRLPNAQYLVEGHVVIIDNPEPSPYTVITEILANKTSGVHVFVGINPDSGALETADEWQFDAFPTSDEDLATVAGLLHVGLVKTDASTVTAITASTLPGFGIVPNLFALSQQFIDLDARVTALESGGGGGGGGAAAAERLPWQTTGTGKDTRDTVTVVNEKLAAVLAAAIDAAQAGGEFESPTETDQIWNWLLANRRAWGIEAPNLLRFLPGGGAEPGLHGTDSAPSTEQFDISGTLPAVPEDRDYDSR